MDSKQIFSKIRPNLKFYISYIDHVVIFWEGTEETTQDFFREINYNPYNISFTVNWSHQSIN